MSDRGHDPVATAQSKHKAETNKIQAQASITNARSGDKDQSAKYVPPSALQHNTDKVCYSRAPVTTNDGTQPGNDNQLDEVALIEERRKRREAIKAKHKGQATPLLVQALALDGKSTPNIPNTAANDENKVLGEYQ